MMPPRPEIRVVQPDWSSSWCVEVWASGHGLIAEGVLMYDTEDEARTVAALIADAEYKTGTPE